MKKIIILTTLVSAGIFGLLLFSTQFCGEFDFINYQTKERSGGTYCGFELPFMKIMYEVGIPRWYPSVKYYPQLTLYFLVIWFLTAAVIWFLRRRRL